MNGKVLSIMRKEENNKLCKHVTMRLTNSFPALLMKFENVSNKLRKIASCSVNSQQETF